MKELLIFLTLITGGIATSARECCPGGGIMTTRGKCGDQPMAKMNCTIGRMLLKDAIFNGDKVSTQDSPDFVFVEDPNLYCAGRMYKNFSHPEMGTIPIAIVCFEEIKKSNDIETSGILTLVSVLFLLATLAVYVFLPKLRDLQGLCYMCLCISMALGFLALGVLQLSPGFKDEICTVTGFLVYTWMIATFFWMNVICINVYRTVLDSTYLKKTERRQYAYYSCYAWGGTILLLIVTLIANYVEGDHFKPNFGVGSCWFNGRTETWLYFYGPISILITSNVVLFILSSFKLVQHKRKYEVNKLNNLKHSFLLSLKLFLVMGISWVFEIASFAHGEAHIIWKIMDTFNCLQGVVIFLLLVVLRKRVITSLAEENCCLFITRPLSSRLSPHDDTDDQQILPEDTVEVRLN
ncbi:probable G-protein coupled receptor Mth-like 3 [Manduca sexta]|uniref:probable G-protein coupled receptor Mth-like 3 n=1 Tax=Manduca sexta TaxID=7130 RepID=UPI0011834945|nr:probable G-protein coupled receptor Mth-like 3 [Manduca sexta]